MALTKREFAEKLRTMNRAGSKAPLQNVKLPTNQSNYRTPSMRISSPDEGNQPQVNPQSLAAAGGLLGKIGKGAWDAFHRPESLALDKASSANLGNIGGMLGLLQGSNVDVAANMAGNTAGNMANLPVPSMLGSGVPVDGFSSLPGAGTDLALQNGGMLGSAALQGADAAGAGADAASGVASSVPVGSLVGAGLSAAGGNYGKAAGQAIGGIAGSYFGPLGTMAGSTIGGMIGDWIG